MGGGPGVWVVEAWVEAGERGAEEVRRGGRDPAYVLLGLLLPGLQSRGRRNTVCAAHFARSVRLPLLLKSFL